MTAPRRPGGTTDLVAVWAVLAAGFAVVALWIGGQAASVLTGRGWASGPVFAGVVAVRFPTDPGRAWASAMPAASVYWLASGAVVLVVVAIVAVVAVTVRCRRGGGRRRVADLASRSGMAVPRDIRRVVGARALTSRIQVRQLRPTLAGARVRAGELGWRWGVARGVPVWTSVRDPVVLLGPSGAGKGVYVVIPRVLDAPGPVVVTSTRPDVLAATIAQRAERGPVGVIAADGSTDSLPQTVRWSPIQGCEDGSVAAARAQVLAAGTSTGVQDATFWQGWTEKVIKALLHAAALGERSIDDLWRWSQTAAAASIAVRILSESERDGDERVEAGWADTLAQVVDGDERFRDNVWAGVGRSLAGLDLSAVRRRFDPAAGGGFDADRFLDRCGTLYLLAQEDDPASRLLQCVVDDITQVAKARADRSLNARLDPPLALVLDEIANFAPLPRLPVFVSAYGGSGIVTFVVIQSRKQMNRTWGSAAAEAIWDAATIKGILGGITSAEDLRDFAAVAGDREEVTWQSATGRGPTGRSGWFGGDRTWSESARMRPVLETGEIRGLPEGTMLMFYKGLDPMLVTMTPHYERKDFWTHPGATAPRPPDANTG